MKLNTHFTLYRKINSIWAIDQIVICNTLELLEENKGENICDHGFGDAFLDVILKVQYMFFK